MHKDELAIEHIFINFSRRSITILDTEGYEDTINWQWNKKGAEGFQETVSNIQNDTDSDIVTYCFSEQ